MTRRENWTVVITFHTIQLCTCSTKNSKIGDEYVVLFLFKVVCFEYILF